MHVVLLGNGIAGVTAARHVRKADPAARITLVSDETATPFARTALMYVYMGVLTQAHTHMYEDRFWTDNRIERLQARVERVDADRRRLVRTGGEPLAYDRLLIATGSTPAIPEWSGAGLEGVQGLYHLSDLDRMTRSRRDGPAVVVGGGLIGVELAEMLRTREVPVTFLVRDPTYLPALFTPEESDLVSAAIRAHGVDLRFDETVADVEGGGRVEAVVTERGERLAAAFVGVGTGVRPNVDVLNGSGIETARGVLVDETLQTNVGGVFAAGDCAELRRPPGGEPPTRPIWYTARLQGAVAGLGLAGRPTRYEPGVFFNSAKFFDLEYQVYGRATGTPPQGESNTALSDGSRSIRLQHRADASRAVVGVSALGVRLRQSVCSAWIAEGWPVERALDALPTALFDPEFTRSLA